MATRNLITSATSAALAGTVLICLAAAARAEPVYHLSLCSGPCGVSNDAGAPPSGASDGLDGAAFQSFFDGQGLTGNAPFGWTVTGGNAAGLMFGHVLGQSAFLDVQFVFMSGQVLCCTADFPYQLVALNDHGLFIGADGDFPFASSVIGAFNVFPSLPALDGASTQFLADHDNLQMDGSRFLAIDNAGRISGTSSIFGAFILAPAVAAADDRIAVPEPSSWMLLAGVVGWGLFVTQRGSKAERGRVNGGAPTGSHALSKAARIARTGRARPLA